MQSPALICKDIKVDQHTSAAISECAYENLISREMEIAYEDGYTVSVSESPSNGSFETAHPDTSHITEIFSCQNDMATSQRPSTQNEFLVSSSIHKRLCLVCLTELNTDLESVNIFRKKSSTTRTMLNVILTEMIKGLLVSSQIEESTICKSCFLLLDHLDHLQQRVKNATETFLQRYNSARVKVCVVNDNGSCSLSSKHVNYEDISMITEDACIPRTVSSIKSNVKHESIVEKILLRPRGKKVHGKADIKGIKGHTDEEDKNKSKWSTENNVMCRPRGRPRKSLENTWCEYCNKWIRPYYYLTHLNTHTKDVSYPCPQCKMVFYTKSSRLSHQRRNHQTERRYHCSHCNKAFIYKKELERHISSVHQNIRKFSCEVCGVAFKMMGHLNYHMRSHTGERPNICTVCNKTFRRPSELKNHLEMVHKTEYHGKYRERLKKYDNSESEMDSAFPEGVASIVTVRTNDYDDSSRSIVSVSKEEESDFEEEQQIVLSEDGGIVVSGAVIEENDGTLVVVNNGRVLYVEDSIIEEG